jgi:polyhydroxyalkanoate synthesis regulator phasin
VAQKVLRAVAPDEPAIAGPIIDQAVKDGNITRAQGDELKAVANEAAKDGRPHLFEHRDLLRDENVREVAGDISRALATQAPSIGGPVIDQAVKDGKLTQEQGDRAKQRLAEMAKRAGG